MNKTLQAEKEYQDKKVTDNVRAEYTVFYDDNIEVGEHIDQTFAAYSGRILIYGCGDNDITEFSNRGFDEVIGIDISPKSVEKINMTINEKNLGSKVKCLVMDAEDLKFEDGYFDTVFGTGILHHLDIDKAMGEISRVLKKDGRMIFMEPLGLNPLVNLYRNRTPEARTEYEHPLKPRDIKKIGKYFSVTTKGFYLFTIFSLVFKAIIQSERLYKISRYLFLKLDLLLLFLFPSLKYLCWIVVVKGVKSDRTKII